MISENTYNISAILTAHGEGSLAAVSLNSFLEATDFAEAHGLTVQKIVVLDKPNAQTSVVFEDIASKGFTVLETEYGDQGFVRNHAAQECAGDYVAFLDGDDLWSENWLYEAWTMLSSSAEKSIAHPEFNWFFGGVSSILIGADQEDELFAEDFLRFANYWDAMCMAPRSVHLENPYCKRQIKDGFAFEDWHWNCQTYENGCIHKIVSDTVHFKRRRQNSQTMEASGNRSLMPATGLTEYSYSHQH